MLPINADRAVFRTVVVPASLFVLLTAIWGSSYFFTAIALDSVGAIQIVFLRVLIGCVVLGGLIAMMRLPLPRTAKIYAHVSVVGTVSIAAPFMLITEAQKHVDSSLATVLVSTTPIFVFIITTALGVSRLSVTTGVGILLSFLGIASLYFGNAFGVMSEGSWTLVIVLCALMFAIGNVYTRRTLSDVHPIVLAFMQLAAALVIITPYLLLTEGMSVPLPGPIALVALLELGVLGSAAAYVIFSHLIQIWGSTAASVNTYLQPVFGVLLGVVVLGEAIPAASWLSISAVLIGVIVFAIGSWRQAQRARTPTATNY